MSPRAYRHSYYATHLLLYALSAPTLKQQAELFRLILDKKIMSRATLFRRRHELPKLLPHARLEDVDKYEREMARLIKAHEGSQKLLKQLGLTATPEELLARVGVRVRAFRVRLDQHGVKKITIAQAAELLHVHRRTLLGWVDELGFIKRDAKGLLKLSDVRQFVTGPNRWILPAYKTRKRVRV